MAENEEEHPNRRNEHSGSDNLIVRSDYIRFHHRELDKTVKAQLAKGKLGTKDLLTASDE